MSLCMELHLEPTNMYKYKGSPWPLRNTIFCLSISWDLPSLSIYLSISYLSSSSILLYSICLWQFVHLPSPKPHDVRFYREHKSTIGSHASTSTWKWKSLRIYPETPSLDSNGTGERRNQVPSYIKESPIYRAWFLVNLRSNSSSPHSMSIYIPGVHK